MRNIISSFAVFAALLLLSTGAAAQARSAPRVVPLPPKAPPVSLDTLPALPQFTSSSPRHTLLFADRAPVAPRSGMLPVEQASAAVLVNTTLPSSLTGTGKAEPIQYQLPTSPDTTPYPLVVAYHGFGNSAGSVAAQSVIDEYCELHGWAYLSVTGIDDKIFGTPVAQANMSAAIQWMLDHSDADPERIYLVGFSMGGGVVMNYAARHRDPAGIMPAAVLTVSGSFDWTMAWTMDPAVQSWLLNPWNFGAPPGSVPFAYQRSSALHFDPLTYPPVPGTHLPLLAMATNLSGTPIYSTWDTSDTIPYLPSQNAELVSWLDAVGSVSSRSVTGTVDPSSGAPATHSWAVMDPDEAFDFFEGRVVERFPASFRALVDENRTVSWAGLTQHVPGTFSSFAATVDTGLHTLWVHEASNLASVTLDLGAAGLGGASSVRLVATSSDAAGTHILLTGLGPWPGYARPGLGAPPVAGLDWLAPTRTLRIPVAPFSTLDVEVPLLTWTAGMEVTPDPVARGEDFTLSVAAEPGSLAVWLILGLTEWELPLKPGTFIVPPMPPAVLLPVPLDLQGNVAITVTMPDVAELSGVRLLFQGAVITAGFGVTELTNPVALDVL